MPRLPVPPPDQKGRQGSHKACWQGQFVHQVPEEKQQTAEHHGIRTRFGPPHVVLVHAPEGQHQNPPAILDDWVETMGSGPRPDTQLTVKSGPKKLPDFHMGKLP